MADGPVLVVGGTGFVAAYVMARLVRQGVRVRTTVRSTGQAWTVREHLAAAGAEASEVGVVLGDLDTDPATDADWPAALQGCRADVWAPDPPGLAERSTWRQADAYGRLTAAADARGMPVVAVLPRWADRPAAGPGVALIAYGDVLGPLLSPDLPACLYVVGDLLERRSLGVPRRWLNVVDVRDLAELAHRAVDAGALDADPIEVGSPPVALPEISRLIRDELGEQAGHARWLALPDPVVRALARIRPKRWRPVLPELGHAPEIDSRAATALLGHPLRPVDQTVLDTARSIATLRPRRERGTVPAWTPMGRI